MLTYDPGPYFTEYDHSWGAIAQSIFKEQRRAESATRAMEQSAALRARGLDPARMGWASAARGRAKVTAQSAR